MEKDGIRKAIFVCHAKVFEFYMTSMKLKGFLNKELRGHFKMTTLAALWTLD